MTIQWLALLSFVLVTSFTPGPNNISAMSLGIAHGYRKSLRFLSGIALGFMAVMCLCALVATVLLRLLPFVEPYLRILGSLYIVWLAFHTFVGSLTANPSSTRALGFRDGALLQILNAKVVVYGLTLYATFLASISGHVIFVGLSAIMLAMVGFAAISLWSLAGTAFSRLFQQPLMRRILATVLSLLLLYSAVESSGVLRLLERQVT
ncbi:MAG TPA: LysE family transporter [Spirochaetia bacterium]|nr:LysE family transporter [Spirochaetia bacterium]